MKCTAHYLCITLGVTLWAAVLIPAAQAQRIEQARQAEQQEGEALKYTIEGKPIVITVEGFQEEISQCQAFYDIEYFQSNTMATLETTIENGVCGASQGSYGLTINVRDTSGELHTLEFEETWQRSDAQNITSSKEYPIGENVDLVSVRTRRARCTCTGE